MEKNPEAFQIPFRTANCAVHGLSIRGLSHEMGDMPLQDSYAAAVLENGWIVMAVADGVGSEPRAETGARLAAEAAVDHLRRFWGYRVDDESVETMMYAAFQAACAAIFAKAVEEQAPLKEYSTTLHMVIFSDGLLYLLHAGDGGVAMITETGEFRKLTAPMKGEDGESVVPLLAGPDAWQFSVCRDRAQCVLLATDGLMDKICPSVLAAYGYESGMEKSIASYFLSPWSRNWREMPLEEIREKEQLVFRGSMEEALPEFYDTLVSALAQGKEYQAAQELVVSSIAPGNVPLKLLRGIKDDITLLSLVRFDPLPASCPVDRFVPPDWKAVNAWVSERLYTAPAGSGEPEAQPEKEEEPESASAVSDGTAESAKEKSAE